ncbi:hypothetical protein AB4345_05280 [Vibrio breoganii]
MSNKSNFPRVQVEQKNGNVFTTQLPNDSFGSMFHNENAQGNQPSFSGTIMIDGSLIKLAGWRKQSKTGQWYISLQGESLEIVREVIAKDQSNTPNTDEPPF